MMEPANRDLHWQHAATEREALFDRLDAFLAEAAAGRAQAGQPGKPPPCPECGHQLGHEYRRWRGAVLCCSRCPWERP